MASNTSEQEEEPPPPPPGSGETNIVFPAAEQDSRDRLPSTFNFTDEDMIVDINDITLGDCIGKGNFAQVFIGQYYGDYVAVKKQKMKEDMASYLFTELALLSNLNHENLIAYIGCGLGEGQYCFIVTEYLAGGDLRSLLVGSGVPGDGGGGGASPVPLSWKFRVRVTREILAALQYLHAQDVLHRDIKSENVLLTATYKAKLCDFGFARKDDTTDNRRMTLCGTDEYMARE